MMVLSQNHDVADNKGVMNHPSRNVFGCLREAEYFKYSTNFQAARLCHVGFMLGPQSSSHETDTLRNNKHHSISPDWSADIMAS